MCVCVRIYVHQTVHTAHIYTSPNPKTLMLHQATVLWYVDKDKGKFNPITGLEGPEVE